MKPVIHVLAVGDPAVMAYVNGKDSIINRWEKQNNVGVDFQILPWQDYYPKLISELENTETVFDIVMVAGHFWKADFVTKGYLEPLDGYFSAAPPDYDSNDILQSVRDEMSINHHQYLIPSFSDGHLIFYQKDLIHDYFGISVPSVVSVSELFEWVQKIHGKRKNVAGIALKAHESEIMLDWLPYLRQEGTDLFDDGLPSFNNEKGIRALEKYVKLKGFAPQDTANYGNEEIKICIQEGKCAFAVSWGGQAGEIMRGIQNREQIGYTTFERPWNVTWSFAVPSHSSQKELAMRLLFYLSSKAIDQETGCYAGSPVRYSSYDSPKVKAECPWYGAQLAMLKNAKPLPDIQNSGTLFGFVYHFVHQCFIGELSPAEALRKAEEEILKTLNR
jgi:multiple sugar transport system substrate-binding protein